MCNSRSEETVKASVKPRKAPKQARSREMVDVILEATARVLAGRGYMRTNTNAVAEVAGVSVGSIYQYFPNKDALIAAVHRRHALQMRGMIVQVLSEPTPPTLRGAINALVNALLQAHLVEPGLHQVLETEFPLFDAGETGRPTRQGILDRVKKLLEKHRREINRPNLDLAAYIVLQIVESLVHKAVLQPPEHLSLPEIEEAVSEAVAGYLTLPARKEDGGARE